MFGIKKGIAHFKSVPRISLNKYSYCENLIKNATDGNNFGPTSLELNELSHLSFRPKCLSIINKRLLKRLESRNPIQVLKCLTVIYFLLQTGSAEFIKWMSTQKYIVRSLVEYQANTKRNKKKMNASANIREKASEISKLLDNKDLLLAKREEFKHMRLSMKLPTPRSSIDVPPSQTSSSSLIDASHLEGLGKLHERRTRSLDISSRRDVLQNIESFYGGHPGRTKENTVVFSSSHYPKFLQNHERPKLGNILEMDEDEGIKKVT